MKKRQHKWAHVNLPLAPEVLAKVDKVVESHRRAFPGRIITRLDIIRGYIAAGLPS